MARAGDLDRGGRDRGCPGARVAECGLDWPGPVRAAEARHAMGAGTTVPTEKGQTHTARRRGPPAPDHDRTVVRRGQGSARPGRRDRLSPIDVSNLRVEDHGLPMHVAAFAILEGTPLLDASRELRLDALRGRLEQRLALAPRLRQALFRPRVGLGPPLWVDDSGFDVRQTLAIPAPGDESALLKVCAELNDPPLDRSRPLWEMWLLTGLADGTVGMLFRLHHIRRRHRRPGPDRAAVRRRSRCPRSGRGILGPAACARPRRAARRQPRSE